MAAAKARQKEGGRPRAAGKRPKKGVGGRMPVKRSINLVLVDENKINPIKAILGILVIVALAFAFGKYLVADRLVEMSQAQGRVTQLRQTLNDTMKLLEGFGEVETTYAHYTYDDMTKDELSLVDRTDVVELVRQIMVEQDNLFDMKLYNAGYTVLLAELAESGRPAYGLRTFRAGVTALGAQIVAMREQVLSWSIANNVLTVELTGKSLNNLNKLARKVEENPIVDSCTLITANKDAKSKQTTAIATGVRGKFIIYLLLPPAEEVAAS